MCPKTPRYPESLSGRNRLYSQRPLVSPKTKFVFALLCCGLIGGAARAGFVATAPGMATADFEVATYHGLNGIQITLTNIEGNTTDAGLAISGMAFTVVPNANLGVPSALKLVHGTEFQFGQSGMPGTDGDTINDAGPFTSSRSHWGYGVSGSTVTLETAGSYAQGAAPTHMIVAPGSTPNNSLVNNHQPSFDTSATFFLEDDAVNSKTVLDASDITNVTLYFGTGPDSHSSAPGSGSSGPGSVGPLDALAAPAPPSVVLFGLGGLGLVAFVVRARWRPSPAPIC